jgi:hypothetical protein
MSDLANVELSKKERDIACAVWVHQRNGHGPSAMAVILEIPQDKVTWYADWFQARLDAGRDSYGSRGA